MSNNPPAVVVIREIFDVLSSGRRDWHHAVMPGDGTIDVVYYERDVRKDCVSIGLDSAEAFAEAILACAKEMRESE